MITKVIADIHFLNFSILKKKKKKGNQYRIKAFRIIDILRKGFVGGLEKQKAKWPEFFQGQRVTKCQLKEAKIFLFQLWINSFCGFQSTE